MKILALIDVDPAADPSQIRADLPRELRGSWKLFETGFLREAYATATPSRVVFVVEADSTEAVRGQLGLLPLVAKQLVRVELVELRPFVNWSRLFAEDAAG